MKTITEVLHKQKELNDLLGYPTLCDYKKINDNLDILFASPFYEMSRKWLNGDNNSNLKLSFSDNTISNFSQKRHNNEFNISFLVDMNIYEKRKNIGYLLKNQFNIKTKESLNDINNKTISTFLIDEENKEIAFLYLDNGQRKTVSIKYNEIEFVKGEEHIYEVKPKSKLKR